MLTSELGKQGVSTGYPYKFQASRMCRVPFTPLADLHSQLCGLVYVAWLLSLLRPQADDHDQ